MSKRLLQTLGLTISTFLIPVFLMAENPASSNDFAWRHYQLLKNNFREKLTRQGYQGDASLFFLPPSEICNNGIDDDGDGLVDANDPDCGAPATILVPAGSFIINMGVQPQTVGNALKPYGLVWHLLHQYEVPVVWSINPEKGKDGTDFTHNGVAYKGGPFIILAQYRTPDIDALIAAWQAQGVVGVTTTSDFEAPLNRILSYSMNWTLNKNNGGIAQGYLDRAGIPSTAYNWTLPQDLNCCNDVFLIPHSEPTWATHNRLFTWNASPAQGGCGGTIWAGCKSGSEVENIVNPSNPAQRMNFLMLNPVAPATTPAVPSGNHSDGTLPYSYGYHTHPVMQFLGTMDGAQESGAEQIYLPKTGWRPTTFVGVWDPDHPQVPSLSPGPAAKLAFGPAFGDATRGQIMYQASHRIDKATAAANIAAQRAFLNFSFLASAQKAIKVTASIPSIMVSDNSYPLSASATGGSGTYYYKWTSACPGTFSNPFSAATTFYAAPTNSNLYCDVKVTVTDNCGTRVGFDSRRIFFSRRPAPPEAVDDYEETQPGSPVTVNALANDKDPNEDPLTLTQLLGPANTGNGVFVKQGNSVVYTPNFNFVGVDQIKYIVCDNTPVSESGPLCDTATIYITVDWNDGNGCNPNQYYGILAQGNATSVLAQNSITNSTQALGAPVLVNSSSSYYAKIDNNNDYLVLNLGYDVPVGDTIWLYIGSDDGSSATLQVEGTLTSTNYVNGTGFYDLRSYVTNKPLNNASPQQDVVAYVPATGPVRRLRFTRATGAGKPGINGVQYVDMACVSAVPVANHDAATICEDKSVEINVLANDSDPRDLPLEVTLKTPPLQGVVNYKGSGVFKYQPNKDYSGADAFTYQICNSSDLCQQATVSITITDDGCPIGQYASGSSTATVFSSTNTTNAALATGAPNNAGAVISANGGALVLDMGSTVPLGANITIYLKYAVDAGGSKPNAAISGATAGAGPFSGAATIGPLTTTFSQYQYTVTQAGGIRFLRIAAAAIAGNASDQFVHVDAIEFQGGSGCGGACLPIPTFFPIAQNDSVVTVINRPVTISVQNNDLDPSDLGLVTKMGVSDLPDNGVAVVEGKNILYTPNPGFSGIDQFNYVICNFYGCDSALVKVNVLCADPGEGRAIQGMVFNDLSYNGIYNSGEMGVGNVKIKLYNDVNANGQLNAGEPLVDTALTDQNGNYVFYLGNTAVSSSSSSVFYAVSAAGSVLSGFPLANTTEAPNGSFVKLGKENYVVLEFSNTIPLGSTVTIYLASDKKKGSATITGSLDGTTFSNPVVWTTTYTSDPGNPPPSSAITAFSYQVAASNGIKFIKITRDDENIYVDAASWKQVVTTGSNATLSLSRSINASSDDAEEEGTDGVNLGPGSMLLNSTDLEITQDLEAPSSGTQKIGLRFNTINIPPGAVINSATLSFRAIAADAPNTNNGAASWTIRGENVDHATTFTTTKNNISNRTLTSANVGWVPTAWSTGTTYASPDIKNIIQEIVSRPGWSDGNSMAFVISGTGSRSAGSFDGGASGAPVLNISYSLPSNVTATLSAEKDNQLTQGSTNNFGASSTLESYNAGGIVRRPLFKFDLSNIPANAVITSASLELYAASITTANTPVKAHRLTADWTEGTATGAAGVSNWTQRLASPATNWTTPGGDFHPTPVASIVTNGTSAGTYSFNLAGLVQGWISGSFPNHGLILLNDPGYLGITWRSSEGVPATQTPRLILTYTVGGFTSNFILAADPLSLPPNSTMTTSNIQVASVYNPGEVDCANNFGLINNLPPIANPDTAYVAAGTTATINVVANDSDPEGTPLTVTILTNPPNGTATNNGNGTLKFTPNNGFLGWQTFLYRICDQGAPSLCDTTTVSVLVSPFANRRPAAQNDYDTTVVNFDVETNVLANDFDADFDVMSVSLSPGILQPSNGTIAVLPNKEIVYTPNPGFTGNDTYEYIVCDNRSPALCDTATVFIHVRNQPPVAVNDQASTGINIPVAIPVLANDVEPDGHSIVLMSAGPTTAATGGTTVKGNTITVNNNGTPGNFADDFIQFVPASGFTGLDTFYYQIRDTGTPNGFDVAMVQVQVRELVDLELTKAIVPGTHLLGGQVTFTLTLINKGPSRATNILVKDLLTASYTHVSNTGGGFYTPVNGVWFVPALNAGQSAVLQITATVVNASALKNITEVIACDQQDIDSTPNNDDGDQSEDDEDSATPILQEVCNNGIDDDQDGLTDCADSDCGITANAGPDAGFCVGSNVTITASATGGQAPYTFAWSNGLGSGATKTVSPATSTTYTITVTSAMGCTSTDQVVVGPHSMPVVNLGPGVAVCNGTPAVLTANITGGTAPFSYTWSHSLGSGPTKSVTPSATTTYSVTVSDNNGCTGTGQVVVTVRSLPVANAGADATICSGLTTTLVASATGGVSPYTYAWSHALGSGANKPVSPATTTTYTVTATSSQGCTSTDQVVVFVNQTPVANAGPDVILCKGFNTVLTASATGGAAPYTFSWSNGLGNGAVKTVSPNSTRTYTVTVTSANGCVSTAQVTVIVQNCPEACGNGIDDDGDGLTDCADLDCGPQADLGGTISICQGMPTTLSLTVNGGLGTLSYAWSHGLGNSGTSKTVTPASTTTYSVTVTAQSGCTDVAQKTVNVSVCIENCTNGIDDDGDGLVDCNDPDCSMVNAPVLQPDVYTTCPGLPFTERVTYNDGNLQNPTFSIQVQPLNGSVTIDGTGKFFYTPFGTDCMTDFFTYRVCNQTAAGCCSSATVQITLGDNIPPVLTNVPADLTIGCDDAVPPPGVVTAFDQCPGIYVSYDEFSNLNYLGACETYTITRTWTATDLCGNAVSDNQVITVLDQTKPEIFQVYTLENGKRVVAGVSQRVTHDWKYVKFPVTFSQAPVVLTQVASVADVATISVKQRNVTTQGFEMRVREEELADGIHAGESIAWVAIEPGKQGGEMTYEAGSLASLTHLLQTLNFTQAFDIAPLFFASVQTSNEMDPAIVRRTAISNSSAQLFLQEETSKDAETAHAAEKLGFLAIQPGSILKDKKGNEFGETGVLNLTNAWATINLTRSYTKPVVIIGGLSNNDADPVTTRVRNVTGSSFQASLQEWNYQDGSHSAELVPWMVIEGSIPGNGNYYCGGGISELKPGVNVFAVDNCDDLVAFGNESSQSLTSSGLQTTLTWIAFDDCGNVNLVTRYDTCALAAIEVKAMLYGPLTNNGNNGLMRDDLRTNNQIPVIEPFSSLPAFPHVNNTVVNYITICHAPGTAGQTTMSVPENELQAHLDHGDVVGPCGSAIVTAPLPAAAQAATFRTIKNGAWNDPTIWLGGVSPGMGNISNKTISVEHQVVYPSGELNLKVGARLWVTNGSLTISNGKLQMQNDAKIWINNSIFTMQNGAFEMWTGSDVYVEIKNSNLNMSSHFSNWTGKRKMENVCMNVGQNFLNYQTGIDTLINVTGTVGGLFANQKGAKMYAKNSKFRVINGNVENEQNSIVSGDSLIIWVELGNVINNGSWTAPITQYCIAGNAYNMGSIFPVIEDCGGLPNYFNQVSCLLGNTPANAGNPGGNNGGSTTSQTTAGLGTIDPVMLTVEGEQAVVDWLLVELRDPNDAKKILAYATAVLQRDGQVVSEDGDPVILFPGIIEGNYYVTIRHRNHLGLMTDTPVFLSSKNPPLVDFTDPATPVRGGATSGRTFNGKRTLWAGDFNEDGKIIYQGPYNDVFHLFSRVLSDTGNTQNLANYIINGYELQDLNLDGKVIYQGPNNDRATMLYHTILVHPSNVSLLANFIVSEKLP